MSSIELFAQDILDLKELQLAKHLEILLNNTQLYDASLVVEQIIPIYWERSGKIDVTLSPDIIYRPFYYIHLECKQYLFKEFTRSFLQRVSNHMEGCLVSLTSGPPTSRTVSGTFGQFIEPLKNRGIISNDMANNLHTFNQVINISSKHPHTHLLPREINERTFSVSDASCAFIIMRKLSKELFLVLKSNGVPLPQDWPSFKNEWLSLFPKMS